MSDRIENMKPKVYPKKGSIHIHRIVAQELVGRPLKKGEVVHHIDGDPHNNDTVNLMVFKSQADHMAYHMQLARKSKGKK